MIIIQLTKGKSTIIDDDDDYLTGLNWFFTNRGYAARQFRINKKKQKTVGMHRIIMDAPDGIQVDHINGNKLDNRRSNLRLCTNQQNQYNQSIQNVNKSSKYKGVYYNKINKNWRAQIRLNKKHIDLGSHKNEIDAAKAYNKKAIELFGKFAKLNIIN